MKTLQEREENFKRELEPYNFPEALKQDFFDYWTEPNKSKTKMRYEQEKTWDMGRRLRRWESNNFKGKEQYAKEMPKNALKMNPTEPKDTWEELDQLMIKYQERFDSIPFSQFGNYYDFMKSEKLMKQFDKDDIAIIKESYQDNYLCRCACVKMTLDCYINSNLTFGQIKRLRNA